MTILIKSIQYCKLKVTLNLYQALHNIYNYIYNNCLYGEDHQYKINFTFTTSGAAALTFQNKIIQKYKGHFLFKFLAFSVVTSGSWSRDAIKFG